MRCAAFVLLLALPAIAQPSGDAVMKAMREEMDRSRALKIVSQEQPYYIEYALHDGENVTASATLGALIRADRARFRLPRIQVRVGSYDFDNTNFVASDFYSGTRYDTGEFPLDDLVQVLRSHFWLATDMAYKGAVEAFSLKRAALRNVTQNEQLPDFYHAPALQKLTDARVRPADEAAWAARVKRVSQAFAAYPSVLNSTVSFEAGRGVQYLLNSEGTALRIQEGSSAVIIRGSAQAPDGMRLRDARVFQALEAESLPGDGVLEAGAKSVAEELTALATAPVGEEYSGPVLFEGIASAQMFAEVLGRNLAVVRRPVGPPGRPVPVVASELENRIGVRILPEWMDVVDDPLARDWDGHALFGHYEVDLEGVAAQKVTLVEKGVLKSFLLTRQPAKGFEASNGHARMPGAFGAKAAGIGNFFVRASQSVPSADLRKKLIDLCRERNRPYGILIRKMDFPSSASFSELQRIVSAMVQSGGTARPVSQPVLVYRVYQDGREELVRGMRLRGFNSRSLKDILAASSDTFVFDFYDNTAPFALMNGASFVSEASAIAPSVLIDDLELERARDELPKLPLVPAPPLVERAAAK